jgi:thiol-disulfide isomerase/thioredoxin
MIFKSTEKMKSKLLLSFFIILFTGIISAQNKQESATTILDDACLQAGKEGKNVMIVFHASWCGWCKKFEASIEDPSCKGFFDKHFIIKYLDILEKSDKKSLETPGAEELYNQSGGKGGGIPFFLIYDKNKKLVSDSKIRVAGDGPDKPLQNIGCPASNEEVAAFIKILEKAVKINAADKNAITERFKKNKS